MKKILVVCDKVHIDRPLRRSLAHLVKSCRVEIAADGYSAYEMLRQQSFDLIAIDFEINGIDSLELIETILHLDPGVPIVLMLKEHHRMMWGEARRLTANPIFKPFKPLTFLRLVDTLLHQHLERYRELSEAFYGVLETLQTEPDVIETLLIDQTGQILLAAGSLPADARTTLGQTAAAQFNQDEANLAPSALLTEGNCRFCLAPVIENLYLGLVTPAIATPQAEARKIHIAEALHRLRHALYKNTLLDGHESSSVADYTPFTDSAGSSALITLPVQLDSEPASAVPQPPAFAFASTATQPFEMQPEQDIDNEFAAGEQDEVAVNWQILSNNASTLNRLQKILAG